MADSSTTTTTTKSKDTTTTTTVKELKDQKDQTQPEGQDTTSTTTVAAAPAEMQAPEKHGEVSIDENADAHELKEQKPEDRLEQARGEAMRNHAAEHANDKDTNKGDPTTRDKE